MYDQTTLQAKKILLSKKKNGQHYPWTLSHKSSHAGRSIKHPLKHSSLCLTILSALPFSFLGARWVSSGGPLRPAGVFIEVPKAKLRGGHAFAAAAPKHWNNLPIHVWDATSLPVFKSSKTQFFNLACNTQWTGSLSFFYPTTFQSILFYAIFVICLVFNLVEFVKLQVARTPKKCGHPSGRQLVANI